MKRITLETLQNTKKRKSTSKVISQYKDRTTVCKDATNTRPQHIKVKTASDYWQNVYRNRK